MTVQEHREKRNFVFYFYNITLRFLRASSNYHESVSIDLLYSKIVKEGFSISKDTYVLFLECLVFHGFIFKHKDNYLLPGNYKKMFLTKDRVRYVIFNLFISNGFLINNCNTITHTNEIKALHLNKLTEDNKE